jgi:hypothetical protein
MRAPILLHLLALASVLAFGIAAAQTAPVAESPLPEKVESPPSPESAPTVNIRQIDNGDVVEEYRQNGRLYEVRVRPRVGPTYTLRDTNGDGLLNRRDSDGPVAPVYYTLYQWD